MGIVVDVDEIGIEAFDFAAVEHKAVVAMLRESYSGSAAVAAAAAASWPHLTWCCYHSLLVLAPVLLVPTVG